MKRTTNSLRFVSSMVVVALLGLVVGGAAWGERPSEGFYGTFTVFPGHRTNEDHKEAIYSVMPLPAPEKKATLIFMQYYGRDKGPFVCERADWDKDHGAYRCENDAATESLTIGTINGEFCESLRKDHNRDGNKVILESDECEEGRKCACYEIVHRSAVREDQDAVFMPPGAGAGSGKDN